MRPWLLKKTWKFIQTFLFQLNLIFSLWFVIFKLIFSSHIWYQTLCFDHFLTGKVYKSTETWKWKVQLLTLHRISTNDCTCLCSLSNMNGCSTKGNVVHSPSSQLCFLPCQISDSTIPTQIRICHFSIRKVSFSNVFDSKEKV
jgi:hypothetical protein